MRHTFILLILLSLIACQTSQQSDGQEALANDEKAANEEPTIAIDENGASDQQEKVPVVYVTQDGDKYHTADCRYSKTAHEMKLSQAKAEGKTACGICKPNSTTGEKQIRCSANTADGSRCKRMTTDPSGKCFQHRES